MALRYLHDQFYLIPDISYNSRRSPMLDTLNGCRLQEGGRGEGNELKRGLVGQEANDADHHVLRLFLTRPARSWHSPRPQGDYQKLQSLLFHSIDPTVYRKVHFWRRSTDQGLTNVHGDALGWNPPHNTVHSVA